MYGGGVWNGTCSVFRCQRNFLFIFLIHSKLSEGKLHKICLTGDIAHHFMFESNCSPMNSLIQAVCFFVSTNENFSLFYFLFLCLFFSVSFCCYFLGCPFFVCALAFLFLLWVVVVGFPLENQHNRKLCFAHNLSRGISTIERRQPKKMSQIPYKLRQPHYVWSRILTLTVYHLKPPWAPSLLAGWLAGWGWMADWHTA